MSAPQMEPAASMDDFNAIIEKAREVWDSLPAIDYDKLHEELSQLNVAVAETQSITKVAHDLYYVQGLLTRASEIRIISDRDLSVKKTIHKTLASGWIKFSSESSQDKRKADADIRMWQFTNSLLDAEVLNNATIAVIESLTNKYDILSRLVTIAQLQQKLSERLGGTLTPEASFSEKSSHEAGDGSIIQEEKRSSRNYGSWNDAPSGE